MTNYAPTAQLVASATSVTAMLDRINEVGRLRHSWNVNEYINNDASPTATAGLGVQLLAMYATSASTQVDLPTASAGIVGYAFMVLALDVTNTVTIAPDGTDTINGVNASRTIGVANQSRLLLCVAPGEWFMATSGVGSSTMQARSFALELPVSGDDVPILTTLAASTIHEVHAYLKGGVTSVDWTLRHGTDPSAAGTELVTGGTTTTATTAVQSITTFNAASLVANSVLRLDPTAVTGSPGWLAGTVFLTED